MTPRRGVKLLGELANERESLAGIHRRRVPMLVKVAPDLGDEDLEAISRALRQSSFDGVVATNTTIARPSSLRSRHAGEAGGLSGAPLHEQSVRTIRGLRRHLGPSFPIMRRRDLRRRHGPLQTLRANTSPSS